jgi:hypothetical protein
MWKTDALEMLGLLTRYGKKTAGFRRPSIVLSPRVTIKEKKN